MKLNKKYLTIGAIVVALTWMIGTVNGQTSTTVIEDEVDINLIDENIAVEIEWEEEPIARAAGYKDASSLKGNKKVVKISKSDKKKYAKLFGFKDASSLKGEKKSVTNSKGSKKQIAKSFGYKDAASLKVNGDKKVITISKSDHKQLAKMFGFKSVKSLKGSKDGKISLSLDNKQKKLIAKAFGFASVSSLKGEKKKVKFTKSEKNTIKKALRLR